MRPGKSVKKQARSEVSRQAVIEAVTELIDAGGYSKTTTANIARQAGVSWGVLQYHFGGKREIFDAVLQSTIPVLVEDTETFDFENREPGDLMSSAMEMLWRYYSSANYRASMEILLNHSHLGDDFYQVAIEARTTLTRFFHRLFEACASRVGRSEEARLAEIAIATLRGLSASNAIFPMHARPYKAERKLLQEMLISRIHR